MSTQLLLPELGLEGQLSPEDLGAQWEHSLHELSPQVKKCEGAESATLRLKNLGIPQVISFIAFHGYTESHLCLNQLFLSVHHRR